MQTQGGSGAGLVRGGRGLSRGGEGQGRGGSSHDRGEIDQDRDEIDQACGRTGEDRREPGLGQGGLGFDRCGKGQGASDHRSHPGETRMEWESAGTGRSGLAGSAEVPIHSSKRDGRSTPLIGCPLFRAGNAAAWFPGAV
jgi:hypothetical protein